jgi:hypothetical protein
MNCYGLVLRRDAASCLASDEKLRMMSFTCSTSVELFHLLSMVLMAMTASNAVVATSNHCSIDPLHGSLGSFARVLAGSRSIDAQEAALGCE